MPASGADLIGGKTRELFVLTESIHIDAQLHVEEEPRRLGMYEVPVFVAKIRITGEIDFASAAADVRTRHENLVLHADRARLVIPVEDVRGLRHADESDTALLARALEPAGDLPFAALAAPIHSGVDVKAAKHRFAFELTLAGAEALDFLPLAGTTDVTLRSNWPTLDLREGCYRSNARSAARDSRRTGTRWA